MIEQVRPLPPGTNVNDLANYWVRDYRLKRYLRGLTDAELEERTADIFSNLMVLRDDGKYAPRYRLREDGIFAPLRGLNFSRMLVDAYDEGRIRVHPQARNLSEARLQIAKRLSDESWCRRDEWVANSRLSEEKYERPRMLFRFSRADYNAEFIKTGRVRLSPASHYNDAQKSNAVRDDELQLDWYDSALQLQSARVADYYAFCISSEYDYRLYSDFKSDSCVAIREPEAFVSRMRYAIAAHKVAGRAPRIAALYTCPVIYVDPFLLSPVTEVSEVHFCKHFRYAYQTEFRLVLVPVCSGELQPFFLQLGFLEDIAEMVPAAT
jgi:hypothetical protein